MKNNSRGFGGPTFLQISLSLIAAALVSSAALAQDSLSVPQVFRLDASSFTTTTAPALFADARPVALSSVESSSDPQAALPNAPDATVLRGSNVRSENIQQSPAATYVAPRSLKFVLPDWTAQPLTAHDKVMLGLENTYTLFSFLGIVASAGYSHLTNGQPNYGADRGAFGQRLGSVAIRDTSEDIFTDCVFAPLLHEDPRYYVEGARYGLFHRLMYAVTRPIITRTDSGRESINGSLLLGYASASAIAYSYYPPINQNAKDTVATFGGALAGATVGDVVNEFADGLLIKLHLKKAE